MIRLTPQQTATLRHWFLPDRPGPLIGLHVIQSGHGTCWVDRWPEPRALYVDSARNGSMAGDPGVLTHALIRDVVAGFVEAPPAFVPLLTATFPNLIVWDRVIYSLSSAPTYSTPAHFTVRRLTAADATHLARLSDESSWISKTWGGAAGLAASGYAWGAFAGDRLAAVANSFFLGDGYEEIGVVTEPEFRRQGLSVACAGPLCAEVQGRGRTPSWTTSTDNVGSRRVAEKLGFTFERNDVLYVIGIDLP